MNACWLMICGVRLAVRNFWGSCKMHSMGICTACTLGHTCILCVPTASWNDFSIHLCCPCLENAFWWVLNMILQSVSCGTCLHLKLQFMANSVLAAARVQEDSVVVHVKHCSRQCGSKQCEEHCWSKMFKTCLLKADYWEGGEYIEWRHRHDCCCQQAERKINASERKISASGWAQN